jgi:hypothetical protein
MRCYLIATSIVFGLITVAHIWRIIAESSHRAQDPWFYLLTLAAAGLCVWALWLLRRLPRS